MLSSNRIGEVVSVHFSDASETSAGTGFAVILAHLENQNAYVVAPFDTEGPQATHGRYAVVVEPADLIQGSPFQPGRVRVDRTVTVDQSAFKQERVAHLQLAKLQEILKKWASLTTQAYYAAVHQPKMTAPFVPGRDRVNYAGRVFDEQEMVLLTESALDFWLTAGPYANAFESKLAKFLGVRRCALVNSGSSANLLAFAALTSPKLGDRRIFPGDEVITVAAGFPTTVAPIIQYGAVPVFVDVTLPTYNVDCTLLDEALSAKTKAVMLAHTLGNPFDLEQVKRFCTQHNLWLIEDNCDALGSQYFWNNQWHYTGTIGHIGTSSFYPPHHMTMGEGGAVYTQDPLLGRLVESFRDWGRDCWCPSGRDNTCNNRFKQQFGALPLGYDHKYVYSHFGYNLKATDLQAAIGCAQLEKLPAFTQARRTHWQQLRDGCADLADRLILPEPTSHSNPSWFGFLLTVREGESFTRDQIVAYLESKNIQTRMLFAGNLLKHPCFDEMRQTGHGHRVVGTLATTDQIMRNTFWVGVYPGMTDEMISYMILTLKEFFQKK